MQEKRLMHILLLVVQNELVLAVVYNIVREETMCIFITKCNCGGNIKFKYYVYDSHIGQYFKISICDKCKHQTREAVSRNEVLGRSAA